MSKNEFDNNYSYIYPGELELKRENKDLYNTSFFDPPKEVYERKLTNELFDERDAFPFHINWITIYLLKYFKLLSVLIFLRIARIIRDLINMVNLFNILLNTLKSLSR